MPKPLRGSWYYSLKRCDMLVFGIDIPIVEIILAFALIIFILLVEAIVIIALMVKQLSKAKKLGDLMIQMSDTLLEIKRKEIEQLDRLRRK